METDEAGEGRIGELSSQRKLLPIKPRIVMLLGLEDDIMTGVEGLNDDPSRLVAADAPSRYLRQDLEGPFGGTEIREIQGGVGGDNADQGDGRKVVSFGNHLGADEDINLSMFEVLEDAAGIGGSCDRVAVHPGDSGRGKELPCLLLDPFRSCA